MKHQMNDKMRTKQWRIFADEATVEPKAMVQFYDAMKCDFAVKGAVMPDIHVGYSLPIGSVVATEGVIVPAWVGYDIGCGVLADITDFDADEVRARKDDIFDEVCRSVPVGTNAHRGPHAVAKGFPAPPTTLGQGVYQKRNGACQLGTLGSGNHFIEIGFDDNDAVWIIIHSGSRGTGHGLAGEYMKIASGSTKAMEGHYGLDEHSHNGMAYVADMNWALSYALVNRSVICTLVMEAVRKVLGIAGKAHGVGNGSRINRNHNHAEKKDGLWIHRKGATHAEAGMKGVIPGNMRDGSFIVQGKGNPDSLCSSSHGAGRVMSRSQAKETLSLDEFTREMGIIAAKVSDRTIDESPMAYKSIFDVMAMQDELVDVLFRVKPIINVKG